MSFGKMNAFIDIISTTPIKDAEGFATTGDIVLASVRAYKEERHGTEKWANMAAFSTATALFRFRKIPGLDVDATLYIVCGDEPLPHRQRGGCSRARDVCGGYRGAGGADGAVKLAMCVPRLCYNGVVVWFSEFFLKKTTKRISCTLFVLIRIR